jgi:hypothetical protein
MMSNAATFLKFAAMLSLFLIALTASVELSQAIKLAVNKTDELVYGMDNNLVRQPKTMGEYTVNGAEVLQSIFHIGEIGASIVVDGYYFPVNLQIDQTNVSMIHLSGTYTMSNIRNADGTLNTVIFNIR